MIKIGLKLWNVNVNDYLPLSLSLFRQGVFDYIELYVVPGHLDLIEEWASTGIPFDVHAPHSAHGMNLASADCYNCNCKLLDEVRAYADGLRARYVVFHGGTDGTVAEVARQLACFGDVRTLIENKPHKPLPFVRAHAYVGSRPEEMQQVMNIAGCGFCLDIGHAVCSANSYKIDPYDFIHEFAHLRPNKIHLSDIYESTEDDVHLNFGLGDLRFDRVWDVVCAVGDVTIETNKQSRQSLDDFVKDVVFLRGLAK